MEIVQDFHNPEGEQDASKNSTQPSAEIQVFHLHRRKTVGGNEPAYSIGKDCAPA